jgi:beta-glucanase (GH16 family)
MPVLVYNHRVMRKEGVPADRARSTYVHPLYGLDGEVLTDDFPKDHYHHRGLFWAWPHVGIGGKEYDLWMLKGVEQRFEKWVAREANGAGATLKMENGWFVKDKKVMREEVGIRIHPATAEGRHIDLELAWTPTDEPVTLRGAEDKSYGGLTLRFAPRTDTVITTPFGQETNDLTVTRLPWADLSARFAGRSHPSGAAILVAPDHPDFPPEWLTRHYGVLCLGWPGVIAQTIQPGQTVTCKYRVWIHRGAATEGQAAAAFGEYAGKTDTLPEPPPGHAWKLGWSDEFAGAKLDTSKWELIGDSKRRDGYWVKADSYLDGHGNLILRTAKDGDRFTSGAIRTRGKFEHAFGYWVVRCKLPKEPGHWPAFWLMGDGVGKIGDGGEDGTEIDIFEAPWRDGRVTMNLHWDGYGKDHKSAGTTIKLPELTNGFHTFALWWKPDEYVFYTNGKETWRTNAGGVSKVPEFIKLTEEFGEWGGDIKKAKLPDEFVVDYVRVYDLVPARE